MRNAYQGLIYLRLVYGLSMIKSKRFTPTWWKYWYLWQRTRFAYWWSSRK